jgi:hypothetical protein
LAAWTRAVELVDAPYAVDLEGTQLRRTGPRDIGLVFKISITAAATGPRPPSLTKVRMPSSRAPSLTQCEPFARACRRRDRSGGLSRQGAARWLPGRQPSDESRVRPRLMRDVDGRGRLRGPLDRYDDESNAPADACRITSSAAAMTQCEWRMSPSSREPLRARVRILNEVPLNEVPPGQIRGHSSSGFARSLTVQAAFRLPEPELPGPIARWKAERGAEVGRLSSTRIG